MYSSKLALNLRSLFISTIVFVGSFFFVFYFANSAFALTWDGGGADNNWSTCANWSGDICPSSAQNITFDSTSNKTSVIDTAYSINSFFVDTGFTGTITMNANLTTLDQFSHFLINSTTATFNGNQGSGYTLDISCRDFTVLTPNFTPPDTIKFTGAIGATFNIYASGASTTFNNVILNRSAGWGMSNDTWLVNGNLTLNAGSYSSGTFNVQGNVTQNSFTGSGATGSSAGFIDFGNDSIAQTYTINGGNGPVVRFDSAADANDSIIVAAAGGVDGLNVTSGFSGTANITNMGSHVLSIGGYSGYGITQAAGTLNFTGTDMLFYGSLSLTGGSITFGTNVTLSGGIFGITFDVNSSVSFTNLTVNRNSFAMSLASNDIIYVNGTLTLNDGSWNGSGTGGVKAKGSIVQNSGFDGGNMVIDFDDDSITQTYTINGGVGSTLRFDNSTGSGNADANDSIDLQAAGTLSGLTISSTYSAPVTVTNVGNYALTLGDNGFSMSGGSWDASNIPNINFVAAFTIANPATMVAPTTLTATGSNFHTINVDATQTLNNFTVNKGSGSQLTVSSGDTLVVNGTLTLTDGAINTGTLNTQGDTLVASTFDGGNAIIDLGNDPISQTITLSGGTSPIIRFDDPDDKDDFIDFIANATIGGLTVTSGFGANDLTINNGGDYIMIFGINNVSLSAGTLDLSAYTTNQIQGNLTINSGATFISAINTVSTNNTLGNVFDVNTTQTFMNLEIANGGTSTSLGTGDTLVSTGTLTLTNGAINNGSIDTRGNINQVSTFDGGSTVINFGDNAAVQTYTLNGGIAPTIQLDNPLDANDHIVTTANCSITSFLVTAGFGSNIVPFDNTSNVTVTFGNGSISLVSGSLNLSSSTLIVFSGNLTIAAGFTYTASTNTKFAYTSNGTVDVNTSQDFNNIEVANSNGVGILISSGDTLMANGLLTFTDGGLGGSGSVTANGNISQGSSFDGGGIVDFGNNSTIQTYTLAGGTGPTVRFDNPADQNDIITISAASSFSGLNFASGFAGGSWGFNNPSGFAVSLVNTSTAFTLTEGTFNGIANGNSYTLNILNNLTVTGGTFIAPTTVVMSNGGATTSTWDVNSSITFNNFTISRTNNIATFAANDTFITTGTLTFAGGQLNNGGNAKFQAYTFPVFSSALNGNTVALEFAGSGDVVINWTGNATSFGGDIYINKPSGKVSLSANTTFAGSGQDLNVTQGTFELAGKNISATTITFGPDSNIRLIGTETMSPTPTVTNATMTYIGDGDGSPDTYSDIALFTGSKIVIDAIDSNDTYISKTTNSLTENGVSYWKFDETVASDSKVDSFVSNTGTGQGATGTNNLPQPSTDVPSAIQFSNARSLDFDGTDDYVSTATSTTAPQVFSIAFWFKTSVASGHKIIGFENAQTGTGSGSYDRGIFMGTDGKIKYTWYDGFTSVISTPLTYNDNQWHHVALVVNNTSNPKIKLYVDNVLRITGNSAPIFNYAGYWRIGGYAGIATGGMTAGYYQGKLDDMRIYSKSLSETDINYLYTGNENYVVQVSTSSFRLNNGTFTPPSIWSVDGDLVINGGTFNHNNGTVVFSNVNETTNIQIANTLDLYNVEFQTPTNTPKTIVFPTSNQVRFNANTSIIGSSGKPIVFKSSSGGTQATVYFASTPTIQFMTVKDITCAGGSATIVLNETVFNEGNTGSCFSYISFGGSDGATGNSAPTGGGSGGGTPATGGTEAVIVNNPEGSSGGGTPTTGGTASGGSSGAAP